MRLLITNDDGWESPGLQALVSALKPRHEVWVFAPDRERSGQSHSITLKGPIRVKEQAPQQYSCDGTPADCVILAVKTGFIPLPDVVLSGINLGPNLGTDLIYSGTVAAARQACLMGLPSLALSSANLRGPWDFPGAAEWLGLHLEELLRTQSPGAFWNLNFPVPVPPGTEFQRTVPAMREYHDRIESFLAPGKEHFCFYRGALREREPEEGTDWWAVNRGFVALSLLAAQPLVPSLEENHERKL